MAVRASLILMATLPAMASCVPAVAPPPLAPTPAQPTPVVALPPQPLGSDWRDWPVTAGAWRYEVGRTSATFGAGADGYLVRIACDVRQRQLVLATTGGPGAPPLTIRTSTTVRTLPTVALADTDGRPAMRDIRLAANDPLLDAMAFSRGHFTVEEAGRLPLVIPTHSEIGRVIEDCRG